VTHQNVLKNVQKVNVVMYITVYECIKSAFKMADKMASVSMESYNKCQLLDGMLGTVTKCLYKCVEYKLISTAIFNTIILVVQIQDGW